MEYNTTHLRRSTLAVLAACLLAGLLSQSAHATSMLKGPYLLNVTPTAVTVAWQTDSTSDSRVTFTPTGGTASSASSSTLTLQHQLRLTNLAPDTVYSYTATSTGGAGTSTSPTGSFRTAPSTATAFRFAVYGDNRTQASVHAQVANAVLAAAPLFVLDSGDLSSDSTNDSTFQNEFFTPARSMLLKTPLYAALGNHEGESSLYFKYFAGFPTGGGTGGVEWYSFDYSNAHFIVLDTNVSYAPGSAQYNWLVSDLQKTTAAWKFVMTHHPAYSSGTHGSDPGVDTYLVPLFESYHVDAVFHGHDHLYERSLKNGVNYFVSGGGGAPLYAVNSTSNPYQKYALSTYHYITVDVNGTSAAIQGHYTSGSVFDSITLTHTAGAPPVANFSANPSTGTAPLTALFTDTSTGSPTSWSWTFGDGGTSTAKSPSHVFNTAGSYTVTLKATNAYGSSSASKTETVQQATTTHTLTVTAAASPSTVTSAGTASLGATATDSLGHGIAAWKWSDNGAGGAFSSTTVQNPTYTAPANTSGSTRAITLTVTATCNGTTPVTASGSTALTVQSTTTSTHAVNVTVSAGATSVASSGSVTLSMTAIDTLGHGGLAYQWSDGGAGGTFSAPTSATTTYTAPANTTSSPRTATITASGICKWQYPWVTGSKALALIVNGSGTTTTHTLTVTAAASPTTVASAGTASLGATATDSLGHTIAAWKWSDGGAGGAFSSTTVQSPSYKAPANTSGSNRVITLTVTATCSGATPATASASVPLTVQTQSTTTHQVLVTTSASAATVASRGTVTLSMSGRDTLGHTGLAYQWSDGGAGGVFSAPTSATTTYTAPANTTGVPRSIVLTASGICKWQYPWVTGSTTLGLTINP